MKRKTIKFFADEMLTARELLTSAEFGDLQTRLWDYILYDKDEPPDDRTMLALYKTLTHREDVKEAAWERKKEYRERKKEDDQSRQERLAAAAEFMPQIRNNLRAKSNS